MNVIEKIIKVLRENPQTSKSEVCKLINNNFRNGTCRHSIYTQLNLQEKNGLLKKELIDGELLFSLSSDDVVYKPYERKYGKIDSAKEVIVGCYVNDKLVASRILRYPSAITHYKSLCKQYFGECYFKEFFDTKAIPLMKTLKSIVMVNRHAGIKTFQTDIQRATNWFINSTGYQIESMLKKEGIPRLPNHKEQKEVILMLYNKYAQFYSPSN